MTLEQLKLGQHAEVLAIDVGHGLSRRLHQMGLHVGDIVSVMSHAALRGPLLVTVHGMQIAIGRGVARKIGVRPLAGESHRRRTTP